MKKYYLLYIESLKSNPFPSVFLIALDISLLFLIITILIKSFQ